MDNTLNLNKSVYKAHNASNNSLDNSSSPSKANGSPAYYTKEQFIYLIYLADKCERYEDSLNTFEAMIQKYPSNLILEEREMFENSVKSIIKNKQRNLIKICNFIKEVKKQQEEDGGNAIENNEYNSYENFDNKNMLILNSLSEEKAHTELQIKSASKRVLRLIDNYLMKNLTEKEAEVFLLRLKGDLYKYLSQVERKEEYEKYLKAAMEYFNEALDLANKNLDVYNKTFLETLIAYAKFLQDFMKDKETAFGVLMSVINLEKTQDILLEHIDCDDKVLALLKNIQNMIK